MSVKSIRVIKLESVRWIECCLLFACCLLMTLFNTWNIVSELFMILFTYSELLDRRYIIFG